MATKNLGNSTSPSRAPCQAPPSKAGTPKGEAKALANPGQHGRGAVSGVLEPDPLIEKALQAVIDKAQELGVELEGKVWAKRKNRSVEIHAGRPKLGTLTQDELARCDVTHLFKLHRAVELDIIALPNPEEGESPITWSDFSTPLFSIQWALGNLMDSALDEIRLAERQPGAPEDKVAPLTLAYRVIKDEAEQNKLREEASARYKRTNSAIWKGRSEFSISGATMSCASNMVHTLYKMWEAGEIGYAVLAWSWRVHPAPSRQPALLRGAMGGRTPTRSVRSRSSADGRRLTSALWRPRGIQPALNSSESSRASTSMVTASSCGTTGSVAGASASPTRCPGKPRRVSGPATSPSVAVSRTCSS